MSTLSIPNDITNGATSDATKVQANFDAIETFANDETLKKDGSTTATGLLTLLASDPTADDHAARKKYVDDEVTAALARVGGEWTDEDSASTYTHNATTVVVFDTEVSDTDAIGTAGGNTFTVPTGKGGLYAMSAMASTWYTGAAPGLSSHVCNIVVNGTDTYASQDGGSSVVDFFQVIVPLAAGDTVQVSYFAACPSSSLGQNTTFRMFRVGI